MRARLLLACWGLAGVWSAAPPGLAAQEDPGGARHAVGGFLAPSVKLARVHRRGALFAGVLAGIVLGERLRIGGGGFGLSNTLEVEGAVPGTTLVVGYGGLWTEADLRRTDVGALSVSMLLGAGNAEIRGATPGTRLRSDNFLVIEPGAAFALRGGRWLRLSGGAGWRIVAAAEDLSGLSEGDLAGPTVTLAVVLGRP